jgi:hypothetical protein
MPDGRNSSLQPMYLRLSNTEFTIKTWTWLTLKVHAGSNNRLYVLLKILRLWIHVWGGLSVSNLHNRKEDECSEKWSYYQNNALITYSWHFYPAVKLRLRIARPYLRCEKKNSCINLVWNPLGNQPPGDNKSCVTANILTKHSESQKSGNCSNKTKIKFMWLHSCNICYPPVKELAVFSETM